MREDKKLAPEAELRLDPKDSLLFARPYLLNCSAVSPNSATLWGPSVQTRVLVEDSSHLNNFCQFAWWSVSSELPSVTHAHTSGHAVRNPGNTAGDRTVSETWLSSVVLLTQCWLFGSRCHF